MLGRSKRPSYTDYHSQGLLPPLHHSARCPSNYIASWPRSTTAEVNGATASPPATLLHQMTPLSVPAVRTGSEMDLLALKQPGSTNSTKAMDQHGSQDTKAAV